jgi:hypothetical protein
MGFDTDATALNGVLRVRWGMSKAQTVDLEHGPDDVVVRLQGSEDYHQVLEIEATATWVFAIKADDYGRLTAEHACTRDETGRVVRRDVPEWIHQLFFERGIYEVKE